MGSIIFEKHTKLNKTDLFHCSTIAIVSVWLEESRQDREIESH